MTATLTYLPVCMRYPTAVVSSHVGPQPITGHDEYSAIEAETAPLVTMASSLRPTLHASIGELAALENGWHGVGSKPLARPVIDRVSFLAATAAKVPALPDPEFTPRAKGTVSLEWESDAGVLYLEVGKTRLNGFLELTGYEPIQIPNVDQVPTRFLNWVAELLYPTQTQPISSNGMTASPVYAEDEAVAV